MLQLKNHYLQWLMSTQQEEKAGALQEREGNYARAIELYLKAGMAAKAAAVVLARDKRFRQFPHTPTPYVWGATIISTRVVSHIF